MNTGFLRVIVAALLVGLCVIAPMVPASSLFVAHLLVGSGRWAALPPVGMGLPLLTVVALVIKTAASPTPIARSRTPELRSLVLAIITFTSLVLVSITWSRSPEYGLAKGIRLVVLDLVPAVLLFRALLDPDTYRRFFVALRWLALVVCAAGIASSPWSTTEGVSRLSFFGTDPIAFGSLAGVGTLLWGMHIDRHRLMRSVVVTALPAGICGVALIGSNSKGPLVGVAVALIVLLMLRRPAGRGTGRRLGYLRVALVAIVAVVLLPTSLTLRLDPRFYLDPSSGKTTESISLRERLWGHAMDQFQAAPAHGQGLGGFNQIEERVFGRAIQQGGAAVVYPHNVILEVLAEVGVFGLGALLWVAARIVILVRRRRPPDAAIGILVLGATGALFSGDLSDHRLLCYAVAVVCVEGVRVASPSAPETAPTPTG